MFDDVSRLLHIKNVLYGKENIVEFLADGGACLRGNVWYTFSYKFESTRLYLDFVNKSSASI